jgi:hypothetical protein
MPGFGLKALNHCPVTTSLDPHSQLSAKNLSVFGSRYSVFEWKPQSTMSDHFQTLFLKAFAAVVKGVCKEASKDSFPHAGAE